MQSRRDEILAKKAKLAELKKQRELRASSASNRQSIGPSTDASSPPSGRSDYESIEGILQGILGDRPVSTSTGGGGSPARRGSRPTSVLSAGDYSPENSEYAAPSSAVAPPAQLSTAPLTTIFECPPSPVKQVFSYNKGVQTTEDWATPARPRAHSLSDNEEPTGTPSKRLSRRERDREEEIRQAVRREVEEELRATRDMMTEGVGQHISAPSTNNFPLRQLTAEELNAVMSSEELVEFVDKSSKIIERALDQEYDILVDYAQLGQDVDEEDDDAGNTGGKGKRRVKEVIQYFNERWSKNRMISGIEFSPKFPELLLASYTNNPSAPHEPDGIVQVWNQHMHDRAEFVFHAQSDVLTAKFSPFHPNLIVGGTYSGQILLWDTRAKSAPVQKTPLTGYGHTHPIYSVDIVGTQNANNIISCSTDGVVCAWSMDVFAQPQELLELKAPAPAKIEDVSPTCLSFPDGDPTFFLVGTEEGTIYPCHRYNRAGAKAGVDSDFSYKGHTAPVMSVDFHPARGPVDLGDYVLSSSLDWSVKLWKVRAPAATSTAGSTEGNMTPLLNFVREDVVYDAKWSPVKPSVFALVDGAGSLEFWDIAVETEEPVARISPSPRKGGRTMLSKSLNKLAWEPSDGKRVGTGGMDGSVTVFEVASGLGGKEDLKAEEWTNVKKLVNRVEAAGSGGPSVLEGLRHNGI
ncbi:related to dynein intermediate chain 1, cytosolic [Cephalotrichum gorgonifer]|uniref:Related to dynein intermediate chain 1, cytosolic n=1 Tax=Cephalotrichum gorgonifer TaxID=2041049 RepID=A0AAE8MR80_9PEZI|nr:related to dynein intermediate chain 1, cytosolic [Cephalotrichum gorgonifer]